MGPIAAEIVAMSQQQTKLEVFCNVRTGSQGSFGNVGRRHIYVVYK